MDNELHDKLEQCLASYNISITEKEVSKALADIRSKVSDNMNSDVMKTLFSCIDLTTLNSTDNPEKVQAMVNKVNHFEANYSHINNVGAICVYPSLVETVAASLEDMSIGIASVAGGFPASQTFIEVKIAETALAVASGATEIDIVIPVGDFLAGNYVKLFDEVSEIKSACGDVKLKTILETGALKDPKEIYKASVLAMEATSDFIKTSTGKMDVAATPEATYVMCLAIKAFHEKSGKKIGLKPAGGISTPEEAVLYYTIVKEVLGNEWLNPKLFRIGASRLANNLLTAIEGEEVKYF